MLGFWCGLVLGISSLLIKLVNTGADSELCFRPLMPILETKLYFVWKKYQVFTPAAELLINDMREHFGSSHDDDAD